MRIKYIVPFPFDDEGIANRAAQIPAELLGPNTEVECVAVRNSATLVDCYYEDLVFDMYITEAGLRAEEEGYDAVIMDTVSDSGFWALRSRLTIPVVAPGLVSYLVGILLGKWNKNGGFVGIDARYSIPLSDASLGVYNNTWLFRFVFGRLK